jgi:hypothetical protein
MNSKKIAILLRGGISNTYGKLTLDEDMKSKNYVNFTCVKNSLYKHIVEKNINYDFDFFIHSWNTDLEEELKNLYNPVNSSFEDNGIYKDTINNKLRECEVSSNFYNQVSQTISIQNSFKLIEDIAHQYEYVIFYRPDALLWKDIDLSSYDTNNIYCNNYGDGQGDFHFVMSPENAKVFSSVYNSLSKTNPPTDHLYIPKYLEDALNTKALCDSIEAGKDQEIVRKLKNSIDCKYLNIESLSIYGISIDEINSYTC